MAGRHWTVTRNTGFAVFYGEEMRTPVVQDVLRIHRGLLKLANEAKLSPAR
jgi:hypothetical protein